MATSTVKCSTARTVSVSSPKATATRTLGQFRAITGSGCPNLEEGQKVQHEASQGSKGLRATRGRSPGTSCSDAAGSNPR